MGLKHEARLQLGVTQLYCSRIMYLKHEAIEIIRMDRKNWDSTAHTKASVGGNTTEASLLYIVYK